jgi:hypothetical protein
MRILVLEAAAGQEGARIAQGGDHRVIGVTLFALVGDDALLREAGCILGKESVRIHREGDGGGNALVLQIGLACHPDVVIVRAMTGSGVDETGAGIVRHVITVEQRHVEGIAQMGQRMAAGEAGWIGVAEARKGFHLRGFHDLFGEAVGEDELVARLRPIPLRRCRDLMKAIGDLRGEADGAVAGDGPGRGGPDDDACTKKVRRTLAHRELHVDRIRLIVLILDLGFRECRPLDDRPHDGLRTAVELARPGEFQQLIGDQRLGRKSMVR